MNDATERIEEVRLQRFRPYPEYKDSGIEWLGKIPEDWEVKKLKRVCLVRRGASPRPIDDPVYFDDEGEYAWVRIADVTASGKYLETTTQKLSELGKSKSIPLEPGELFLSIAATVGKPIIARIKCCIHDGFVYFVGLHENREYLFYLFSCGEAYKGLGKLGTQLNLNTDTIGDIYVPLPQPAEQRAIVQFLDRDTAKIDGLVARKERLIELLQEKRTALISRAVTRGLDPNVPMKDFGVEWLGEIPAHWEVKRVKQTAEILRGKFSHRPRNDPSLYDGRYPFIQTGDVARVQKVIMGYRQTLNEQGLAVSKMFPAGTLVMTIAANIGDVAVLDFAACFPDSIVGFIPRNCVHRDYLYYVFLAMKPELLREAPVNTQGNLNVERIGSQETKMPLPGMREQRAIIAFLDCETAKIDALIAKIRQAIDHLKEFRTALISAAVTGKIDVREDAS